jgi:hypothetical protein
MTFSSVHAGNRLTGCIAVTKTLLPRNTKGISYRCPLPKQAASLIEMMDCLRVSKLPTGVNGLMKSRSLQYFPRYQSRPTHLTLTTKLRPLKSDLTTKL